MPSLDGRGAADEHSGRSDRGRDVHRTGVIGHHDVHEFERRGQQSYVPRAQHDGKILPVPLAEFGHAVREVLLSGTEEEDGGDTRVTLEPGSQLDEEPERPSPVRVAGARVKSDQAALFRCGADEPPSGTTLLLRQEDLQLLSVRGYADELQHSEMLVDLIGGAVARPLV